MSNPNLNQRFADAVTTLRAKGVIRYDSDIARDLGHSKGNISNYINGKLQPSEKFLEQFYNYYNKVLEHDKLELNLYHEKNIINSYYPRIIRVM